MKTSIVICLAFACFAFVYAEDELPAQIAELKKACAAEHKVTAEQLEKFAADKFVTENEDIKCFTKCMLNKSGSLSDNGVDIEKVVEFAVLKKKDAVKARENAEKCKELFTGKNDCETAVSLIACFKKDE